MEFSQITALQCIPVYDGNPEELEPFILQLELFASQLEGHDQTPLLNVIWMKLKGKALRRISNLIAPTWTEVKANLQREFKFQKSISALMKDIETLLQKPNESFDEYKARGEELYKWIENEGPFGLSSLRKHFLGGLRNKDLAHAGIFQREKSFPELLIWLKNEWDDRNEIEEINVRVEILNKAMEDNLNQISNEGHRKNLNGEECQNDFSHAYVQRTTSNTKQKN